MVSAAALLLALRGVARAAQAPGGPFDQDARRLVGPLLAYTQDLATGDGQSRARLVDVEMALSIVLGVTVERRPDDAEYRIHHLLSRSWSVPAERELEAEPAVRRALLEARASAGGPALQGEAEDRFVEVAAAVCAGVEAAAASGRAREAVWDGVLADWRYFGFKAEGVEWGPSIGARARAQSLKFLRLMRARSPQGAAAAPARLEAARNAWLAAQDRAAETQFLLGREQLEPALGGVPEGAPAEKLSRAAWEALTAWTEETRPAARGRQGALWAALDPEAAVQLARFVDGAAVRPSPARPAAAEPVFEDVTSSVPFVPRGLDAIGRVSVGMALLDYDGDGRPDLYVRLGRRGGRLLRNLGGFRFEDVTVPAGLEPGGDRAVAADYDNDGRPDLFMLGAAGGVNRLYHNEGGGRFKDVTEKAGLSMDPELAVAALWFDYDRDGLLDLYVVQSGAYRQGVTPSGDMRNGYGNKLYHNNGDGTFTEVASTAGVRDGGWGWAAAAFDYDGDGWPDLFVCNNFGGSRLYRNRGDGTFADVTSTAGLAGVPSPCKGVSAGDFAHDGRPGLFISASSRRDPPVPDGLLDGPRFLGVAHDTVSLGGDALYRNVGGRFEPVAGALSRAAGWSWNGFFFDFDLDGWQDLYVVNGFYPDLLFFHDESKALYRYDPGSRRFVDVPGAGGAAVEGVSRGSAFADLDGDGCPDLIATGLHGLRLLRNRCERHGHWLELKLRGTRSNRDGIGAHVVVRAGELVQSFEYGAEGGGSVGSFSGALLVGLGPHASADSIDVRWPSGRSQTLSAARADRLLEVVEP